MWTNNICLVFVEFLVDELVLSLLLERDDDESDEDVDEKERKHDEVNNVEDCHIHSVARLWTAVLSSRVDRMLQNTDHSTSQHCVAEEALPLIRRVLH